MERKTIEFIIKNFEKYVEGYDYNKYPKEKYNLAKKAKQAKYEFLKFLTSAK